MADSDDERKIIKFEDLNVLGKLVFVGGILTRSASNLVQTAVDATTEIISEAEKAFKQGLDPNVEEANILEEYEDKGSS